jgi:quinol monooxygenase YgiN
VLAAWGGWPGDPPAQDGAKGFPDLVAALKASPGCLGVETARTASGKSVIFAWFEDKKAALAWYYSDTHQQVMKRFLPDAKSGRKPLADVPEDSGPIMAVASLTPNDKPTKDNPAPFKQIAIELYQPLGGGLAIGGRFAPEKMKVPPLKNEPKK